MTKLTVLMSVYNGERFLRQAIESVLSQSFNDYEFFIIDDKSQDSSKDIILSYQDKRIRFLQNEKNIGQMMTLNLGIGLAQGQYIARMDQDDISLPERFKKEVEVLDRSSDIDLVYSDSFVIDEKGLRRRKTLFDYTKPYRSFVFDELLRKNFIAGNTVIMRKSIFKNIGLLNPRYPVAAEYDLFLRLSQKHKIAFIDEPLAEYRVHAQNRSKDKEEATIKEIIEIFVNLDKSVLEKRQKKVLSKMISWYAASLGMHHLFQYNRELCKAKVIEALKINFFNPKAIAAIFMAIFFPKVLIGYVSSFRKAWLAD